MTNLYNCVKQWVETQPERFTKFQMGVNVGGTTTVDVFIESSAGEAAIYSVYIYIVNNEFINTMARTASIPLCLATPEWFTKVGKYQGYVNQIAKSIEQHCANELGLQRLMAIWDVRED